MRLFSGTAPGRATACVAALVAVLVLSAPAGAAVSWPSGAFSGYGPTGDEAFATWRGAPVAVGTDFLPQGSWSAMEDPAWAIAAWSADKAVRPVFSTAMWPSTGGSLAEAASGAYDAHFAALGRNLVAAGLDTAVIRLGWEFNGTWYRWSVATAQDAADYAEGWRRIVGAMQAVRGQHFGFDWAPTITDGGLDPALSYPGDAYVTDIGLSVYDWNVVAGQTAAERWTAHVDAQYGLAWQARFAATHGKPVAYPEWGVVENVNAPGAGGGDDPYFVEQMHAWFGAHPPAFESYFNADTTWGVSYGLSTGSGRFPEAAAAYQRLWAAPVAPAPVAATTTTPVADAPAPDAPVAAAPAAGPGPVAAAPVATTPTSAPAGAPAAAKAKSPTAARRRSSHRRSRRARTRARARSRVRRAASRSKPYANLTRR